MKDRFILIIAFVIIFAMCLLLLNKYVAIADVVSLFGWNTIKKEQKEDIMQPSPTPTKKPSPTPDETIMVQTTNQSDSTKIDQKPTTSTIQIKQDDRITPQNSPNTAEIKIATPTPIPTPEAVEEVPDSTPSAEIILRI